MDSTALNGLTVTISGPEGIGKTTLAAYLAALLEKQGTLVGYRAVCDGVVISASKEAFESLSSGILAALEDPTLDMPALTSFSRVQIIEDCSTPAALGESEERERLTAQVNEAVIERACTALIEHLYGEVTPAEGTDTTLLSLLDMALSTRGLHAYDGVLHEWPTSIEEIRSRLYRALDLDPVAGRTFSFAAITQQIVRFREQASVVARESSGFTARPDDTTNPEVLRRIQDVISSTSLPSLTAGSVMTWIQLLERLRAERDYHSQLRDRNSSNEEVIARTRGRLYSLLGSEKPRLDLSIDQLADLALAKTLSELRLANENINRLLTLSLKNGQ